MTSAPAIDELARRYEDEFRDAVLRDEFPCVLGRGVVRTDSYRFHLYASLSSADSASRLVTDLRAFTDEVLDADDVPWSLVAGFRDPVARDEVAFEAALWAFLQAVHDVDVQSAAWDPAVSPDPDDPDFSFSVGGRAFFVIGLHPGASRWARRLSFPALVFNAHSQFEDLRAAGQFTDLRDQIRARDVELQGSVNPVVADHGDRSEAAQYAGRAVGDDWACPLQVRAHRAPRPPE